MSDITIFICEDADTRKEITDRYFGKGRITYAALFNPENRDAIVKALDEYL